MFARSRSFVAPLAIVLAGLGCGSEPELTPSPAQTANVAFRNLEPGIDYVGDDACASCHEEAYDSYQDHGMARAMEALTPEDVVAQFPSPVLYHEPTNLWYQATAEDDRYYQTEFRLSANGDTTHTLTHEMMWVVGSGTIARTYLTVEADLFTEMPLTWYTQRETWDFSPGFEVLNNRFGRAIPDRCVACHNAYPETVPHVTGKFASLSQGISCERCHGPGDLHVNERLENPDPAGDIDNTIINPAHLDLETRLDVCQQCHVTAPISILRDGRDPFAFVPTEPLQVHVALFSDIKPETGEIAVTSHARRMRKSACFVAVAETPEPMDCVTCHDPHLSFRDAGQDYFNATCQGCHAPAALEASVATEALADHQSSSDCTSCHMPKAGLRGVPHSAFTDHWIRVVERSNDEGTKVASNSGSVADVTGSQAELDAYFSIDSERSSHEAEIYRGVAYIVHGDRNADIEATRRGVEILQASLDDSERFGDAHYQLGISLFKLERLEEAEEALETSVRLGPDVPERLNTLAQLYERLGRAPKRTDGLYRHALDVQPLAASIRVNYGRFLETQGRTPEATRQYRIAAEHQPSLAEAHYNLGTAQLRQGDLEAAEQSLREAIRRNPDYSQAYGNLGILYASQGDKSAARQVFQTGVDVAPDDAVALNNLASFFLNEGMDGEALPLLNEAVRLEPDYVDALANLALVSLRLGNDTQARNSASRALTLDPDNLLAQQILAAVN